MLSLNVTALDAGPQLLAVAAGGRIAACNGCGVEVMTATGKRYAAGDRLYEEPTPLYITPQLTKDMGPYEAAKAYAAHGWK